MRKLLAATFGLLLIGTVAATTVEDEDVEIDLSTSEVEVEMVISDLTSNRFTYLTTQPVRNVDARIDGSPVDCTVEERTIGSEITCERPEKDNFRVDMTFQTSGLVESRQNVQIFRYRQSFYRPTKNYSLKVMLPKSSGILDGNNRSIPVVSPGNADIGSDGRRIFVRWDVNPQLGESTEFQVAYEQFSSPFQPLQILGIVALGIVLAFLAYLGYIRWNQESIENVYDELSEDQIEVLELLLDNEGEMLQKDVVNSLDYSKSKISGIVSGLVEKEIVVKEKEGRSNKLSISRHYRG